MTRDGKEPQVFDALVVPDVRGFSVGSSYQTYLNRLSNDKFIDVNEDYYVGNKNNFYLDIRITNNVGSRIPLTNVILDYKLFEIVGSTPVLIDEQDLIDHIEFFDGNQFIMKQAGKTYEMEVAPKYQALEMKVDTLTFRFTVNNGYNAFSNQELKTLFGNLNVEVLNIHRNIEAELSPNQMNSDGSPINRRPSTAIPVTGNVYSRFSTTTNNDNLTIEGNFMTIDGSNLPYSNRDSGSGTVGFAEAFEIINVQVAMFSYSVRDTSLATFNANEFNISNLQIIGNTTIPTVNFGATASEILQQEQLMSKNSGGYVGIYSEHGTSNYTNLNIVYTVIAISHNSYGFSNQALTNKIVGHMDKLVVSDTWANSLYGHGTTGFIVENSIIGQSGGPAIHAVDARKGDGANNPEITIKESNEINNWVSGEEAWFKAYGMSQVAIGLKSAITTGIAPTQRTIIKVVTNPVTGLPSEMLNFIMLTEPNNTAVEKDENEYPIGGSEVAINLFDATGVTNLERPWNFLTTSDPRIAGGQFAAPVGIYSEMMSFVGLATDIKTIADAQSIPMTQAQAGELANLASVYNLSAVEVLTLDGAMQQHSIPGYLDGLAAIEMGSRPLPKYLEVAAPVPVFDSGFSVIIVELMNQE